MLERMAVAFDVAHAFCAELYGCLGRRADALFALMGAAACGGAADSLPHASLVPAHRKARCAR